MSKSSILIRHWRGELPLWVSYWVFGFLVNFVVLAVATVATGLLDVSEYSPHTLLFFLLGIWGLTIMVVVWQLVGTWRSATRYTEAGKSAFWAGLAKLAVILGVLRAFVDVTTVGYPQLEETVRIAFLGDPDIPDYALRIMRGGTEMEISGGIKYGLAKDVDDLLSHSPQVRVVHLDSIGGRIGEADKLHEVIRSRGLDTYVSNQCLSACTVAFAAGRERWLGLTGNLGYHAAEFPGVLEAEMRVASYRSRNLMLSGGVAPWFVDRAFSEPNASMWYPTREELARANVITDVVSDDVFAASGWGAGTNAESIARQLEAIPLYAEMERTVPTEYRKMIDSVYAAYVDGSTQAELVAELRRHVHAVVNREVPNADHATLIASADLLVQQLRALDAIDADVCYRFAMGLGDTTEIVSQLPPSLIARELEIYAQVLRSAQPRPKPSVTTIEEAWNQLGAVMGERVGWETLELFDKADPTPNERRELCALFIVMFEEMPLLEEKYSLALLRESFKP